GNSSNGLEERLYAQQDANFNVTALVTTAGSVVERDAQDPYGQTTVLTSSWSARSTSSYGWVYLQQGLRYEASTGLLFARHRDDSPALMRWIERDPMGF